MTVGLLNVYSTNNLGDAAIYSAIARLAQGRRVLARVGAESFATPGVTPVPALPVCPTYVGVGGDIYNNPRPRLITRRFLANLRELTKRPRQTFVFGQSIPRSCRGLSFQLLSQVFRRLAGVVVRDEESHRRLTDSGVRSTLCHDLAFALSMAPGIESAAAIAFAEQELVAERTALISLRAFDHLYAVETEDMLTRIADLIRALERRGHQPALLIQADADSSDSDRAVAARLQRDLPGLRVIDTLRPVGGLGGWPLLLGILARAHLVIGVRYHAAVLRLVAGRMPFVLHYSNKGADLCRRLAIPGCSANGFDVETNLAAIEATAGQAFDPQPLRRDVQEQFQRQMAATGAAL